MRYGLDRVSRSRDAGESGRRKFLTRLYGRAKRQFVEFDPVLQSCAALDEVWTAGGSFRIPFLIWSEAADDNPTILSGEDASATGNPFVYLHGSSGVLRAKIPDGVSGYGYLITSTVVSDGKLHTGAFTFNAATDTYALEIDGVEEATRVQAGIDNSFKYVGCEAGGADFFEGFLADMMFIDLEDPTNIVDMKLGEPSDDMEFSTLNMLGPELCENGDFSAGLTGWTDDNAEWESGRVKVTSDEGGFDDTKQLITTEIGKVYIVTVDYEFIGTADGKVYIYADGVGELARGDDLTGVGSEQVVFVAATTTTEVRLYVDSYSSIGYFDNVSVRQIRTLNYVNIPEANRHPWERVSKVWSNLDGTELTLNGTSMYVQLPTIPLFAGDVVEFGYVAKMSNNAAVHIFIYGDVPAVSGRLFIYDNDKINIREYENVTLDGVLIDDNATTAPTDGEVHTIAATATAATGNLVYLGKQPSGAYYFDSAIKNLVVTRANPTEQYPHLSYGVQDGYRADGRIAQSVKHTHKTDGSESVDMADGFVFTDWLTEVDSKYGNAAEDINNGATTVEDGVYLDYETEAAPQYAGDTGYETLAERAVLSVLTELEEAIRSAAEGVVKNGDARFGTAFYTTAGGGDLSVVDSMVRLTITDNTVERAHRTSYFDVLDDGTEYFITFTVGNSGYAAGNWIAIPGFSVADKSYQPGTYTLRGTFSQTSSYVKVHTGLTFPVGAYIKLGNLSVRPVGNAVVPTDEAQRRCYESLVKNGDFRLGDDGDWTKAGNSSISTEGASLSLSGNIGQTLSLTEGVEYVVEVEVENVVNSIGWELGSANYIKPDISSDGVHTQTITAINNNQLYIYPTAGTGEALVKSVSVRPKTEVQVLEDCVGHGQVIGDSASDWSDTEMEEA